MYTLKQRKHSSLKGEEQVFLLPVTRYRIAFSILMKTAFSVETCLYNASKSGNFHSTNSQGNADSDELGSLGYFGRNSLLVFI